jgi:hypothetical protein
LARVESKVRAVVDANDARARERSLAVNDQYRTLTSINIHARS